jgi:hypothetical protein
MAQAPQKKGAKKFRGASGKGISQKRANAGQRRKVVSMDVLLGEKPWPKN